MAMKTTSFTLIGLIDKFLWLCETYTSAAYCFSHFKKIQESNDTLKFCVNLGKTAKENKDMLRQAYGDNLMSVPTFYHWYSVFRDDWKDVVDELREGCLVQLIMKFYKTQRPLSYEKIEESLFVNSQNIWTFWLVAQSLFCMMIYRCGMWRAGGITFTYIRTNGMLHCCM